MREDGRIPAADAASIPGELGPKRSSRPAINLRDLGFVGTVSEEARERIRELDRRAMMVLTTSERFWFR